MAKRKKPVKKPSPRVTGAPATSQTSGPPPLGAANAADPLSVVELSEDQATEVTAPAAVDPALSDALKAVQALSPTQLINETDLWVSKGHLQLADNIYTSWLAGGQTSARHVILFNHGALLQQLQQLDRALASYREAIQLAPLFGQAYVNLGLLLEKAQLNDQALAIWGSFVERARQAERVDVEMMCTALNHIGRLNENIKRYEAAELALEKSLALNPKQPGVIQHWVHIRQKSCCWPLYKDLPGVSPHEMYRYTSPLATLAIDDDPVRQLFSAEAFVRRTYNAEEKYFYKTTGRKQSSEKIRVGIVSGDLKEHAVGFLVPAFLEGVDKSKYELIAYDFSGHDESDTRETIKALFDEFKSILNLNDEQAATLIATDGIDILIDMHGLSKGARPNIFSFHPSACQVTYLGFIGTTALPWFDYVIADPVAMPKELEPLFTEKVVHVNGSFIPLAQQKDNDLIFSRAACKLPQNAFVMASFGNVYKITEEMFLCWCQLLKEIDNSVLWLIDDNPRTTKALRASAERHGIDQARIIFLERCDPVSFRAKLRLADVFLDTYPYNCGSTSKDVINANIPLISRYGRSMVSRMGLSILSELGQPKFATATSEGYMQNIRELAYKDKSIDDAIYTQHRHLKLPIVLDTLAKSIKHIA